MARRRDVRRLGRRPYVLGLQRGPKPWGDGFPYDVPGATLHPVLSSSKPQGGYFLRAESFFNIASFVDAPERFIRAALDQ